MKYFQRVFFLGLFTLQSISVAAVAQPVDCSVVLKEGLIDTQDITMGFEFIDQLQFDICNKDFESAGGAQKYASNLGLFGKVLKKGNFSFSSGRSGGGSSYEVRDSLFCNKSSQELFSEFSYNYDKRIGRFILETFNQCIKDTQSTGLWMSYDIRENGNLLRASLTRKATESSSLAYEIQKLNKITTETAKVECNIGDDTPQTPELINRGTATFTCKKTGIGAAVIDLKTSIRDFSLYMPSNQAMHDRNLAKLSSEIERIDRLLKSQRRIETGTLTCTANGKLNLGVGWRERDRWTVHFAQPFQKPPKVTVAVSQIEMTASGDLDAWAVGIDNVESDTAEVVIHGASISSFSNCRVQWIAVGR